MNLIHNGNDSDLRVHVLRTLLYYDIFSYPLKCSEVFRFLGTNSITEADVQQALDTLTDDVIVYRFSDLYSVQPGESNIRRRLSGNVQAEKFLAIAREKATLISKFPFVRAVFASGSLSKGYMDEGSDIDYFIITAPKRLWIARTLLVMYKRLFLKGSHKHFCVNYFVDEDHLEIEEKNLFTATELATVLPLYGAEQYNNLIRSNNWLKGFFPNYSARPSGDVPLSAISGIKKTMEALINACFAVRLESFFKDLTMRRWKKLYKTGYSKADFEIAFKTKEYASKNHPQHFQKKVMEKYAEKLKHFDFSLLLKNGRSLQMDNNVQKGGAQKRMKLLITHSYFYKLDAKQWRFKQPYPPLGTILAASVLRNKGHNVVFFDTNLRDTPDEIVPVLAREKPDCVIIYDDGFNYLTKMCLTNMREAAFKMAEESKKLGCIVIVSSSDAADHYTKYFDHGVDFVVKGEGEMTLSELIASLEQGVATNLLPGLAYQRNGEAVTTGSRPVLRDLDELPLPAWDLVDIDSYRRIWERHHGYFSLNLATTRGCPFKCNWCAKPIYGNRYTSRSPGQVAGEIEALLKAYSPDHFWMSDDIFGLKPGWVQEFADVVNQKGLKFKYKIQSRVDLLLQEDTLDALVRSGIETVWVGAESGSQKILDAMDKGTTVEQIYKATRLMKEKGIRVGFFIQFGYLGESRDDIDSTLKMILDLMPDEMGISVSYPLPGTKFYEQVKDQLKEKQNWTDSDDLALMFQSTYGKEYYKKLHQYIHAVYRKHKGYASLRKLFQRPLRLNHREVRSGLATFYYIPTSFARRLRLEELERTSPTANKFLNNH